MKKSERKEREDAILRSVETSMDKLRRASRKNEKAAALHLRRRRIFDLADLLEPGPESDDSGTVIFNRGA